MDQFSVAGKMISRRHLLYFSTLLYLTSLLDRFKSIAAAVEYSKNAGSYPITVNTLKEAHWAEKIANLHYEGYCRKAISENYPNIAYLFFALAASEKIHADNYRKLIISLGSILGDKDLPLSIVDTRTNLNTAAVKELDKINRFYPEIIEKLSGESHDEAILNCMYSWKSHQQHEHLIRKIKRYSGLFFSPLARRLESMNPNYYVCEICGSTVDEKPATPCDICNYPKHHFSRLERPVMNTDLYNE